MGEKTAGRDLMVDIKRSAYEGQAVFKTIFEESGIGIVMKDLTGHVIEANPAFQRLLGFTDEELHQKTFYDLTYPPDLGAALEMFDALTNRGENTHRIQKRYVRKDGDLVWANITASIIRGEDGHRQAVLEMVEDITQKRQMEAELLEVQRRLMQNREMERLNLAQDLHDGPLQELYGITYQLKSLDDIHSEEDIHNELNNVKAMVQKQIQTLRTLCGELRPPTLVPFGLEKAIRSHSDSFEKMHKNYRVRLELMRDGQSIPERVRLALFRIYQELLNNVARHAQANQVIVRLLLNDEEVVLEVEDNGIGFDVPKRWVEMARQGHLGLVGVSERTELVGGKLKITSSPGKGTVVQITAPRTIQEEMWNFDGKHNETMEKKLWDLSV